MRGSSGRWRCGLLGLLLASGCIPFDGVQERCRDAGRGEALSEDGGAADSGELETDAGEPGDDDAGEEDAGEPPPIEPTGLCHRGWCWENPYPQGNLVWDVLPVSADEAWVVGEFGLVMRYAGGEWTYLPDPLDGGSDFTAIEGEDTDFRVVGTNGGAIRYNEGVLTRETVPPLAHLYGLLNRPGLALAVGQDSNGQGVLLRSDGGSAWGSVPRAGAVPPLWAVTPDSSGTGALILDEAGGVAAFTQGVLSPARAYDTGQFRPRSLWQSPEGSLWLVGDEGRVLVEQDGGVRTGQDAGLSEYAQFVSVHGTSDSDVWVADLADGIFHCTSPSRCTREAFQCESPARIRAFSPELRYAVGANGMVLRGTTDADGTSSWSYLTRNEGQTVLGATELPGGALLTVGESYSLLARGESGWSRVSVDDGRSQALTAVFTTEEGRTWLVGDDGLLGERAEDGTVTWSEGVVPPSSDGGTLRLSAISGSGKDLWVVGSEGVVLHRGADELWQKVRAPEAAYPDLLGVWASDAGYAMAVGRHGVVLKLHATPTQVEVLSLGNSLDLNGVWGSGPKDVWMVGETGHVRHYDGNALFSDSRTIDETLYAVGGLGPQKVWAVGELGAMIRLRSNGTWESLPLPTYKDLHALIVRPDRLWVFGQSGAILRQSLP